MKDQIMAHDPVTAGQMVDEGSQQDAAAEEALARFLDALSDNYNALSDAAREAEQRGHQLSSNLIEDARRGQRKAVQLARTWAEAPLDPSVFMSSLIEASSMAQRCALESVRQWAAAANELQGQPRDIIRRMMKANQEASAAAVAIVGGLLRNGTRELQDTAATIVGPESAPEYEPTASSTDFDEAIRSAAAVGLTRNASNESLPERVSACPDSPDEGSSAPSSSLAHDELERAHQELAEADASGSELGLFILYKISQSDRIEKSDAISNLGDGPEGWVALRKLLKAGLIGEDDRSYFVTTTGKQRLSELANLGN